MTVNQPDLIPDIAPEAAEPLVKTLSGIMPRHKAEQLASLVRIADASVEAARQDLDPEDAKKIGGAIITDDAEDDLEQEVTTSKVDDMLVELEELHASIGEGATELDKANLEKMQAILLQAREALAAVEAADEEAEYEHELDEERRRVVAGHYERLREVAQAYFSSAPHIFGLVKTLASRGDTLLGDVLYEINQAPINRVNEFMEFYDLQEGRLKDYMERSPHQIIRKFKVRQDYTVTHLYTGGFIARKGRLIDHGDNILFRGGYSTDAIEVLLAQVEAKGWEKVHLSGTGPRAAATYIALVAAGYEVLGYEPTPALRRQAEMKARTVLTDGAKFTAADGPEAAPAGDPAGGLPAPSVDEGAAPVAEASQAEAPEGPSVPETAMIKDELAAQIARDTERFTKPDLPPRDDEDFNYDFDPDMVPEHLYESAMTPPPNEPAAPEQAAPVAAAAVASELEKKAQDLGLTVLEKARAGQGFLTEDGRIGVKSFPDMALLPADIIAMSERYSLRATAELEDFVLKDPITAFDYARAFVKERDPRFDEVMLASNRKDAYIDWLKDLGADVSDLAVPTPAPSKFGPH